MKTVLLLGGPASGQRVEVHGNMGGVWVSDTAYKVVPMCSHGEVHWFGVLDGGDPLALLIAGYDPLTAFVNPVTPPIERKVGMHPALGMPYGAASAKLGDDAVRFRSLHSHLCGYIGNGGGEVVTIFQDGATRDWTIRVGSGGMQSRRAYSGASLELAFDTAIAAEGDKS